LFHRNNLIINPSLPYIGLLLILCTLIPVGEPWSQRPRNSGWQMPREVFICAWVLMAVGYSFSGLTKLDSPSWIDGSALVWLLENPLRRPGILRDLLLNIPEPMQAVLTYGALLAEVAFLPLCICRFGHFIAWGAMVAMHLGIVMVVDFADLSLGMLVLLLSMIPRPLRDLIYDGVASRRNWPGNRKATCALPSPDLLRRIDQ